MSRDNMSFELINRDTSIKRPPIKRPASIELTPLLSQIYEIRAMGYYHKEVTWPHLLLIIKCCKNEDQKWKEHVSISKKNKFQHTMQKETEIAIFLKIVLPPNERILRKLTIFISLSFLLCWILEAENLQYCTKQGHRFVSH